MRHRGIDDYYWSNIEFTNGLHNVTNPLDYMIEKQERRELMDCLVKLSPEELKVLMCLSYDDNTFISVSNSMNLTFFKAKKLHDNALRKLRRKLKFDFHWELETI
tara:strand:- start:231 stop:545 length:315 start_codon:yes stop_codon:yes gene_type:complete